MSDAPTLPSCSHCRLPVGPLGQRRDDIDGDAHWFCCYGCVLAFQVHRGSREEPEAAAWLIRLGVGGFLAMNIMLFSLLLYADAFGGSDAWLRQPVHWLLWALSTPLLIVLGGPFFGNAWRALREGRLVTDTLVAIGVGAAYAYSAWQVLRGSSLVYFDTATMVLLLFTLGRYLEAQGRARAARCLAPMLAAERAEVRVTSDDGGEALRPIGEVRIGDIVRVLPGERIAIDGVIVEGHSRCDESALTGQHEPCTKAPGASVVAGSLNGNGALTIRATAPGLQTRWVQIGRLVRDAVASKTLAGRTIDRVAAAFIPFVLLLAAATAWFWWSRGGLDAALLAGLAVLVVACPCSLGLAAPLATALAIGQAAQRGILVRSGGVLERLTSLAGIAFDKTGTLTLRELQPLDWRFIDGTDEREVLRRAGLLARSSDHPIALALARITPADGGVIGDVEAHPGAGLSATIDGERCAIGSAALMARVGCVVPPELQHDAGDDAIVVFVGWAGSARARLALAAAPLPAADGVIADLRRRGLALLLLSGDRASAVASIASRLGIARWHAALMPEDKVAVLREWSARHGPIAMVGDGCNDGPVLAASAVGIAVGGATDLARESADVVLPRDGLPQLPWLLREADRLRRSVRINLLWAFGYNAVALALAAAGALRPVTAAALMAGSSLLVVLRSWQASRRADVIDDDPLPRVEHAAAAPSG